MWIKISAFIWDHVWLIWMKFGSGSVKETKCATLVPLPPPYRLTIKPALIRVKASDCQNATNMWLSIEDLRKKCHWFYKISPFCIRMGEKPIFNIKHWFYSKDRYFAVPDAKRGNFKKPMGFFFLNPLWRITY